MKTLLILFTLVCSLLCQNVNIDLIQDYLNRHEKLGHLNGTVLLAIDNTILLHQNFGFADFEKKLKNTNSSAFDIGSVSKHMTAAMILTLVENGKLDLHTSILKYLPNIKNTDYDSITIHDLLTHTSGIPSILQNGQGIKDVNTFEDYLMYEKKIDDNSVLEMFVYLKPLFKPGSQFLYSNSGYFLLAKIIEEVKHDTFEHIMNKFFSEHGLKNTRFYNNPNLNKAYCGFEEKRTSRLDNSWLKGSGGIATSSFDLFTWFQKLKNADVLSKKMTDLMFSIKIEETGAPFSYAYGLSVGKYAGLEALFHNGMTFGSSSIMINTLKDNFTLIYLQNLTHKFEDLGMTGSFVKEIATNILNISQNKEIKLPQLPLELSKVDDDLKGQYLIQNKTFSIEKKNTDLILKADNYKNWSLTEIDQEFNLAQDSNTIVVDNFIKLMVIKNFTDCKKYLSDEMNNALSVERLAVIANQLEFPDKFEILNYYFNKNNIVKVRLGLVNQYQDIIFYINDKKLIEGIRPSPIINGEKPEYYKLKKIDKNKYIVDGFLYGKKDLELILSDDKKSIQIKSDNEFIAKRK